ncbi:hypothetical protein CGCA056_v000080 [Colletotrichum aenigma]|uniref:uncharacterized protein n=1 Tax=Colletotrichum aenigma TaxID=1215731 RepID=UPI00187244FD|nr:uncharacterized protein CGCA056_v000080 [Colletotrichum aenigma]KAF5528530.1 hypothetical protein CGCA056_v000080 [Colletotrichum aenigma]
MASMEQAEIQPKTSASRHLLSPQNHPQNSHESSKNTSSFHVEKENPLEPFGGAPPTPIRAASMPPHTPKRDTTPYTGRSGRQTPSHETVAKQEYNREISRRKDIEAELEAKDRRLAECENKLKDSEASLVAVRKKWKEAATDLDKVKSSQQRGLYHMTDSELRDSVTRLRYNISRFAIQYFSGKLPGDTSVGEIVDSEDYEGWKDLSDVIGGRHITAEYIRSDRRRPHIIQALIWETIYMDVFGEALWAGEKMAKAFRELSKQLQTPANNKGSDPDIEACRRFCLWRAETAAMIVESINSSKDAKERSKRALSKEIDSVCRYTYEHIMPFTRLTKGLGDEVFDILQEAAKLDEALKRQAVRFDWTFSDLREPFDSNTMTLASGETWEADMDGVWVTTCPGLVRQGRSTGDEFETKTRLLSAEVSWIPSPRAGGSEQKFRRNRTI